MDAVPFHGIIDVATGRAADRAADPWSVADREALLEGATALAYRVALSVLRQREHAEDVAQEALLKAHRRFRSLRRPERFRSWLVRVTFRLALDRQRGGRRRRTREEEAADESRIARAQAEDGALGRERRAAVLAAIDALPRKLRLAILLVAIEDRSVAEAARALGVPEGTVKSRLFLARKALAEKLRWLVNDV
jgi:RNA polymerase sigma-70 factor (ECF subfamily)